MILRFLFYLLMAYMLYRFIVGFVIPVYIATRKVRKTFRNMQEKMKEAENEQYGHQKVAKSEEAQTPGEYIDFEEVKD